MDSFKYVTVVHIGNVGPIQPKGQHATRIDVLRWLTSNIGGKELTWRMTPNKESLQSTNPGETRMLYDVEFESKNDQLMFEIVWGELVTKEIV